MRFSFCAQKRMQYDQSIKIYGQLSTQSALEYTTFMMHIKFMLC